MPILNQFSNALPIWRREERRLHGAFPSATAETRPTGIHLVAKPRKTVATVRLIARSMLHMLRTVSGHIATVPQPIVTI